MLIGDRVVTVLWPRAVNMLWPCCDCDVYVLPLGVCVVFRGRLYRSCSVVRWYAGHQGTHGKHKHRKRESNVCSRKDQREGGPTR